MAVAECNSKWQHACKCFQANGYRIFSLVYLLISTHLLNPNWGVTVILALLLPFVSLTALGCLIALSLMWALISLAVSYGYLPFSVPQVCLFSVAQVVILGVCPWISIRTLGATGKSGDSGAWLNPVKVLLAITSVALIISGLFRSFPVSNLLWGLLGLGHLGLLIVRARDYSTFFLLGKTLSLILVISVTTVLLVEAGTRLLFHKDAVPVDFYVPCIKDPDLLFRLKPNAKGAFVFRDNSEKLVRVEAQVSSQGIRDREFSAKRADEFRIVLLGDSYTMGQGLRPEETFARQLELLLNNRGLSKRVTVVNCGVGGYAPWQERIYLKKFGFDFEPDLVLLQLFPPNDVIACYTRSGKMLPTIHERWEQRLYDLKREDLFPIRAEHCIRQYFLSYRLTLSALGTQAVIKRAFFDSRLYSASDYLPPHSTTSRSPFKEVCLVDWYSELQEAWDLYAECVRGMQVDCKDRGVEFAAFVHGEVSSLLPDEWTRLNDMFPDTPYEMNKDIRLTQGLFESQGIAYPDVVSALTRHGNPEELYFLHDGHFSPLGAKIVAESLCDFLLSVYFVGP